MKRAWQKGKATLGVLSPPLALKNRGNILTKICETQTFSPFHLPPQVVLIIPFYLTDRDADVEKLAEEEAESILVKLVVNVVQIVFQQHSLLLLRIFYHSRCKHQGMKVRLNSIKCPSNTNLVPP